MAKKKELPKAMMGKIIKPVVRAIATGAKAAKKGYQESVAASKASKTVTTSKKTREWPSLDGTPNNKNATTTEKKTWPSLDGTPAEPKNSKVVKKVKISKKAQKVKISNKAKAVGIAVGATAAAAGIYGGTKKHRSLK
jgi:hypothetical protein